MEMIEKAGIWLKAQKLWNSDEDGAWEEGQKLFALCGYREGEEIVVDLIKALEERTEKSIKYQEKALIWMEKFNSTPSEDSSD